MAFFGGVGNTINATFTATDRATPVVRSLRGEMTKLGTRAGGPMGGVIGGFSAMNGAALGAVAGFGALVGVGNLAGDMLTGFIKAGMEGEAVEARLTQSLNNNVQGWERYTQAMDDATDAAVKLGFQDDEQQDSLAQLVAQTKSVTDAIKIQRVAMDLARMKSMSLKDASALLGKAWLGNTTALRRMGVQIDSSADGMDALNAVSRIAAGQAETFSKTFAGATSRLGAEVARLQQEIGMDLLPTVTDATNSFNNWAFGTDKAAESVERMSEVIETEAPQVAAAARQMGADARAAYRERIMQMKVDTLQLGGDLAANLRASKGAVQRAMEKLTYAMDHPLQLQKEKSRIAGALNGKKLRDGLKSRNPMIRAVAEQQAAILKAEWEKITGEAWTQGTAAGAAWTSGFAGGLGGGGSWGPKTYSQEYKDALRKREREKRSGGSGARAADQHIHINMDGREVAHVVNRRMGLDYGTAGSGSRN